MMQTRYSALITRAEREIRKAERAIKASEKFRHYGRYLALVKKAQSLTIEEAMERVWK